MTRPPVPQLQDWDDAYDNFHHIQGAANYPKQWHSEAAAFRSRHDKKNLDRPYGAQERMTMDVFYPWDTSSPNGRCADTPKGIAIFVHGGFWMKFDKSYWSHLAQGLCAAGLIAVIPNYPLAPSARIAEMSASLTASIANAATLAPGLLFLLGHSAGGHLVSRAACTNTALPQHVSDRICQVISISGLHDLRPLMHTQMNTTLAIDTAEAESQSPAFHTPLSHISFTAWVGGAERPEFLRQSRLMVDAWAPHLQTCTLSIDPHHHHFSVIEGLGNPQSPLMQTLHIPA